jgi:preprotein translocase subunit SecF
MNIYYFAAHAPEPEMITVVIYDRIRENSKLRGVIATNELVDDSVNQSLTRSLNTILAALLPLLSLYLLWGNT